MHTLESQVDDGTFYYTWEESRDAWIIGKNVNGDATAVVAGYLLCPVVLEIPGKFEDKPVEVIGEYAFNKCAYNSKCQTRTVIVPKEIKIIMRYGLSNLAYLTNFSIEAGSQLETINFYGLHCIGKSARESSLTRTLVLPSTLVSVASSGIHQCDIFYDIIYCGTEHLLNVSSLAYSDSSEQYFYVTEDYGYDTIFEKYTPIKDNLQSSACFVMPEVETTIFTYLGLRMNHISKCVLHVIFLCNNFKTIGNQYF